MTSAFPLASRMQMTRWTTEPIFDSLGLVCFIAAIFALSILLVPPQSPHLTPRRRNILMGLRAVAAVVLIAALLRPTREQTDERPLPATLAILLDGSRSMTLAGGGDLTRWEVQRQLWAQLQPMLPQEDESLRIVVYEYGEALRELELPQVDTFLSSEPQGRVTDLSGALRGTIEKASGVPLAGIVMVGDGTNTKLGEQEGPQAAAASLLALEIPLWTVPTGPQRDVASARDVALEGLADQFQVFAGNLFELDARMVSRGMDNEPIVLRVSVTNAAGEKTELATREVTASGDQLEQPLRFELLAPQPGSYRLEVEASVQQGEILATNNRQMAFLDVRDGGARVLYLEGEPRWEQLFLRRSLQTSPDFDLAFQWIERGAQRKTWPVDLGAALAPNRYDIYVLGDLDATALGKQQLELLSTRVQEGAGLLLLGGYQAFDAGGYAETPLAEVLPIRMQAGRRQSLEAELDSSFHLPGPVQPRVTRDHPITRIFPEDNSRRWNALKPLRGANRFTAVKPVPGVQVLLQTDQQAPLMVVGESGKGRVITFAGDSTWQWWRQGQQDAHRRFWRQALLWLMRRDQGAVGQLELQMARRRFAGDDQVAFSATMQGLESDAEMPELEFEIVDQQQRKQAVNAKVTTNAQGQQTWAGNVGPLEEGLYQLQATAQGEQLPLGDLAFQVVSVDRELSRPIADTLQLEQLAKVTEEVGGQSILPEDIGVLRELIEQNRANAVVPVVTKWRLGDQPSSGWWVLILFCSTLSTDWGLRKRWSMV